MLYCYIGFHPTISVSVFEMTNFISKSFLGSESEYSYTYVEEDEDIAESEPLSDKPGSPVTAMDLPFDGTINIAGNYFANPIWKYNQCMPWCHGITNHDRMHSLKNRMSILKLMQY